MPYRIARRDKPRHTCRGNGEKTQETKKKLSRDRVFSRSRFAMPEAHAQTEQRCGRRMSLTKMKSAEVSGAKCKKTVLVITHANTRRHQLDIPNAHPQRPASKQNVRATNANRWPAAASTLCAEGVGRGSMQTSQANQASKTHANPGRRCRADHDPVAGDGKLSDRFCP